MKVKATILRERRHPGDLETLAVLTLPRVPLVGEYIRIKLRRYTVIRVEFIDDGEVEIQVEI